MQLSKELIKTCYEMHNKMPTKLSPEIVFFNQAQRSKDDLIVKVGINRYQYRITSSVVDCGFEPRLDQEKDYRIGICCFSTKHSALRSKSKDWLSRNQNTGNVSEWGDMFNH
jgi:hypothetical protein